MRAHLAVLASVSPTMAKICLDRRASSGDLEDVEIVLAEVKAEEIAFLLRLIYTGESLLYKSELQKVVELTKLLKMIKIPAAVKEESWSNRDKRRHGGKEIRPRAKMGHWKHSPPERLVRLPPKTEAHDDDMEFEEATDDPEEQMDDSDQIGIENVNPRREEQYHLDPVSVEASVVEGTLTAEMIRDCPLCGQNVLGRNALGRHMRNAHTKQSGPYPCTEKSCAKILEDGVKLMRHLHDHNGPRAQAKKRGEKFNCSHCEMTYTTESRRNKHLLTKHGVKAGMLCTKYACAVVLEDGAKCGKEFRTAKDFSDHSLAAHNVTAWKCEVCEKRFKDRQNLHNHLITHNNSKDYVCDICQSSFANPRLLMAHRALHLGRRFLCSDCGYKARSSSNLRWHIKCKHGEKMHQCETCDKKFSTAHNLKNHVSLQGREANRFPFLSNYAF